MERSNSETPAFTGIRLQRSLSDNPFIILTAVDFVDIVDKCTYQRKSVNIINQGHVLRRASIVRKHGVRPTPPAPGPQPPALTSMKLSVSPSRRSSIWWRTPNSPSNIHLCCKLSPIEGSTRHFTRNVGWCSVIDRYSGFRAKWLRRRPGVC